jgi:excisionase family DNA binding protein
VTLAEAPEVLTVRELCQILRIGKNQAYALVHGGQVWSCRIGRSIRIPKAALGRFLQGQEGQQAATAGGRS